MSAQKVQRDRVSRMSREEDEEWQLDIVHI
jgi:hypothetical protein